MLKAMLVKMRKVLDPGRRRLLVDDVDVGAYLSESVWDFLDLLAELRLKHFGRATCGDGVLASGHVVGKRIRACHARREFQRQLPPEVRARWFVQTLRGKGYRLRSDVRIRGRGEVGLSFRQNEALPELAGDQ